MKLLKLAAAAALWIAIAAPNHALPLGEAVTGEAEQFAQTAFQAIDEQADWNAGIENFRQAIAASDDTCLDALYQEYLDVTIQARDARVQGASEQSTYQWWSNETAQTEIECQPY